MGGALMRERGSEPILAPHLPLHIDPLMRIEEPRLWHAELPPPTRVVAHRLSQPLPVVLTDHRPAPWPPLRSPGPKLGKTLYFADSRPLMQKAPVLRRTPTPYCRWASLTVIRPKPRSEPYPQQQRTRQEPQQHRSTRRLPTLRPRPRRRPWAHPWRPPCAPQRTRGRHRPRTSS